MEETPRQLGELKKDRKKFKFKSYLCQEDRGAFTRSLSFLSIEDYMLEDWPGHNNPEQIIYTNANYILSSV